VINCIRIESLRQGNSYLWRKAGSATIPPLMSANFFSQISTLTELYAGRSVTPQQLRLRAMHKAWVLHQRGVRARHRVVIAHGNSIEFFSDLLALWTLGASAVPVHPSLTPIEVESIVRQTEARVVLTKKARMTIPGAETLHTEDDFTGPPQALEQPRWPSGHEECLVLFSTGSSGQPKGVRHSWRALSFRIAEIQRHLRQSAPLKTLCFLPTSFGHGLIANCLAPWLGGSDLVLLPDFNPLTAADFSRMIAHEQIGFFSSVPAIWRILQRCPPPEGGSSLRQVHCASAPLDGRTRNFMREWCGEAQTYNVYGLTEVASWIAGSALSKVLPHEGYIGELWGAEAAICSAERLHTEPGIEGEICLRTPSLMLSYLGDHKPRLQEGFFSTGDLGLLDERRHLTLRGRLGEEINRGGAKISPAEIRRCLETHESVKQVWVCAVTDELWGQTVGAMIVPNDIAAFSLPELKQWSQRHLAPVKQPSKWLVHQELPALPNGKPDGKKIALLLEGSIPE
jgi:acyl-CoA synthetase (AMP-forming)/AMP-acid ligase II